MLKRILSLLMCLAMLLSAVAAHGEEAPIELALAGSIAAIPVCQDENAAQVLTALEISGLDAPVTGELLDDEADVISAEGIAWPIPVLWMDGQGQVIDRAKGGISLMPVLLFVMQEGCRAALNDEGLSEIMLPPYLVEVFQSGIVALVVEAQHVTYITGLNSSLNSLVGEEPEPAPTAAPTPQARLAAHGGARVHFCPHR